MSPVSVRKMCHQLRGSFSPDAKKSGRKSGGAIGNKKRSRPEWEDKCFCMCTIRGRRVGERLEIGAVGVRR